MKTIIILIAVLFLSTVLNAQNHAQVDSVNQIQQNIQSDTLVFTVFGMDCPGCEGGLEKQINKIQSIQFSNADWVKQELRIVLAKDSTLNLDELEKRVKKANFTLEKDPGNKE